MTISNRILGAAMGLAMIAGTANAQFIVDRSDDPKPGPTHTTNKSSSQTISQKTIVVTQDDGTSYKIVLENGKVAGAWANGKEIKGDRIRQDNYVVELLGEGGEVLQSFRIATPMSAPRPPAAPNVEFFSSDNFPGEAAVKVKAELQDAPPVMLGINLSEPSDAMRAQLGLGEKPVILVDAIVEGLPAQKAGLKKYDLIVSLDGSDGASSATLSEVLAKKAPGDSLKIVVLRGGEKIKLAAELAAYDAKALGQEPTIIYDDDARFPGWTEQDGEGRTRVWINRGDGSGLARLPNHPESSEAIEALERAAVESQRSAEAMKRKIESAMREAERQVLELRDGQLFLRERQGNRATNELRLLEHLDELENRFDRHMPGLQSEIDQRLEAMERRFDAVEDQLNERLESLGGRMERLAGLLERLAERLETAIDDRD